MSRATIAGVSVLVAAFVASPAVANRVYWADRGANLIQSANHAGADIQTVVWTTEPHSVALDLTAGMIYWTAREAGCLLGSRAAIQAWARWKRARGRCVFRRSRSW